MKCPKCQIENPQENRFCRKCGKELLLSCPKCGAEVLPEK
ncbi:MAG: zinc-ribbon domain-containing protein [Desulfobacterales bacterium]|nr:zinc-ribbon domain-containing protein [Desulfobacterales bacterium]